jgi:sulfate transport system substrate-binding protein
MALLAAISLTWSGCGKGGSSAPALTILNVSYDPTRELYRDVNQAFAEQWQREHGQAVELNTSNGGSGKQARAVIDGQEADVVTLALAYDIDMIQKKSGKLAKDWQSKLPYNSCPYTSTIVFLVRAGNPKGIKDWDDLLRDGVEIVTPDPQTSGGARWNYLAAWGYVLKRELGDLNKLNDSAAADQVAAAQKKAREFLAKLFQHVPVRDTGARGATNRFVRGAGDVLLAWENEALLQKSQAGGDKFDIVTPSLSILAEPPVAVMEKVAEKHGTLPLAEAYLKFLYSPTGQDIVARHYYRPRVPEFAEKYRTRFAQVELFTIDAVFGGWENAQKTHFDQGGVFEQIQKP